MQNIPLYIKINEKVVVTKPKIYVKDIAKIYCRDSSVQKNVENLIVKTIREDEDIKIVYSIMYIIDKISKQFPQTQIINLGEKDFIIEYLINKKNRYANVLKYSKVVFLALIVFIGSGFTIISFNSDVDIVGLFDKINKLVLGTKKGHNVIQISYSVGIGIGIILFFNHFSKKKSKEQPSPIHVEMRSYEKDLNQAIIEDASRNGTVKDI